MIEGNENEKSLRFIKSIAIIIIYSVIGIFSLFFFAIAKVDATSWVQIYPKNDVNSQYISNSNSNKVRFRLCNGTNDTICKSGNFGGYRFSYNWNTLAFAYMQDAIINKNDTVNFELQFTVTALGLGNPLQTNWNCENWGHGAVALVGNRAGTTQTIIGRQWARSSCSFNADSKNSTAVFTFSGSYSASTAGTKVAFLFGSNIDLKPANSSYAYDVTYTLNGFNMQTTGNVQVDVGAIINNQNSNTQNIMWNNDYNTTRITESQQETRDVLTSEDLPDIGNIQVTTIDDTPISGLLLLPLNLMNVVVNGDSGSCVDYSFGSLFGHELKLKCINFENILGSNLYHVIDILMAFFIIYELGKMIVTAFNDITSLRDGFDSLYAPRHAEYKPKHGAGYERVGD